MSLVNDIAFSYRSPQGAIAKQAAQGVREPQILFYAMLFGFLSFVARLPVLAVQSSADQPLFALAAAALAVSLFFVPLFLFGLAAICHWVVRLFGGRGTMYHARLAVTWAALVSVPMVLLAGLVSQLVPHGVALALQLLTGVVFLRQLIVGLNYLGFRTE